MTERPRFSIITFSDNPKRLRQLWKSLDLNSLPNSWEWIIGASIDDSRKPQWKHIDSLEAESPNIRCFTLDPERFPVTAPGVALYELADRAKGKCLIFVDPERVRFHENSIAFIEAELVNDADVAVFDWKCSTDLRSPSPCVNNMQIWNRAAYLKLGGHHQTLQHGLNYDLLCRAKVAGMNIWTTRSKVVDQSSRDSVHIANASKTIATHWRIGLTEAECKEKGLLLLDVLTYREKMNRYTGVKWNGSYFIEAETTSVIVQPAGIINAADCLNYIRPSEVFNFIQNVYDTLADDGLFVSATPSTRGAGAFADPRAMSYWNNLTFSIFCSDIPDRAPGFNALFQAERIYESFPTEWHKSNGVLYVFAELRKLKK